MMGAQRGPPGADLSGGPRVGSRHGNGVGDGWRALKGLTPWWERGGGVGGCKEGESYHTS